MFDRDPSQGPQEKEGGENSSFETASFGADRSQQVGATDELFARGPRGEPTSTEQTIYRFVSVEGWNSQETASVYGVRDDKIQQICRDVQAWIDAHEEPIELGRSISERRTIARLNFLYSEATEAWRESKKHHTISKCRSKDITDQTLTTSPRSGQPSLLVAAGKLAVMQGRFELSCIAQRERLAVSNSGLGSGSNGQHPPRRDCSNFSGEQGAVVQRNASANCASTSSQTPIDEEGETALTPAAQNSRPAQTREAGGSRGGGEAWSGVGTHGPGTEEKPKPR